MVRSVRRSMHAIEVSLPMCCCRHRMFFCISILYPVWPGWLCARRALTHFNSITKHVMIARFFVYSQAFCCARNRNKCCNVLLRTMLATPKSGASLKCCCALVVMPASVRNVWLLQEWPLGHYASNMFFENCAEDFASSFIAS